MEWTSDAIFLFEYGPSFIIKYLLFRNRWNAGSCRPRVIKNIIYIIWINLVLLNTFPVDPKNERIVVPPTHVLSWKVESSKNRSELWSL